MFDCPEVLFLTIHYLVACNCVGRQNALHPTSFGISRLGHHVSFSWIRNLKGCETTQTPRGAIKEVSVCKSAFRAYGVQLGDQSRMCLNRRRKLQAARERAQFLPSKKAKIALWGAPGPEYARTEVLSNPALAIHAPWVAAFASSRCALIRFCSVRRLIPNISAARLRLPPTCSRVSLTYASSIFMSGWPG